ncbi:phage tail sheath subtilisin-like domain-containing protein, partial [Streptomyces sp. SCA3-4]|uniref:phage tail sheath subtilisin-like domain-containing protein n=1 Tax=Streptomyces sichuanensis TaxID=2871810 RepID=UPI001CE2A9C6
MALESSAPGVYVKEVPSGLRIITGAGTSTPAFLGYPVTRPDAGAPHPVRSWNEFVDTFHFRSALTLEQAAKALEPLEQLRSTFTTADGTLKGEAVAAGVTEDDYQRFGTVMEALGAGRDVSGEDKTFADGIKTRVKDLGGYAAWETAGKPWWPVATRHRELTDLTGKLTDGRKYALAEAVYGFFANGGTKCYVVPLDPGSDLGAEIGDGLTGLKTVPDVHMVAVPDLWTKSQDATVVRPVIESVVAHCTTMRNRLAIVEPPPGKKPSEATAFAESLASPDTEDAEFTTVYYPWLTVPGLDGAARTVPPCGHIAGVWARTDAERGVFKAPANQNLRGVLTVPTVLTDGQNGELNAVGVNCL